MVAPHPSASQGQTKRQAKGNC